jgi:hypothetical protein
MKTLPALGLAYRVDDPFVASLKPILAPVFSGFNFDNDRGWDGRANVPKTSMAEIIGQAEPGDAPPRPNKPLNITLGVIAGIFLASVAGAISALIAFRLGKRMRKSPIPSAA